MELLRLTRVSLGFGTIYEFDYLVRSPDPWSPFSFPKSNHHFLSINVSCPFPLLLPLLITCYFIFRLPRIISLSLFQAPSFSFREPFGVFQYSLNLLSSLQCHSLSFSLLTVLPPRPIIIRCGNDCIACLV